MKIGGRWERGSVVELEVELKIDMITIMLVDKNVLMDVPRCDVRQLPAQLATNFFTHLCFVEGVTEENLQFASETIVPKSTFIADSVRYDEDKNYFVLTLDLLFEVDK